MHPRCGGSGSGPIPGSGAKWNLRNDRERESGPRYDRVRVFPHIRAFVSNRPGAHRGFDYKGVIEMTETQVTWLTQESHDRLKSELDQLISNRPVIAAEINERREEGDLKENGGYHAAREEQGQQEARIRQLQELLNSAKVGEAPTQIPRPSSSRLAKKVRVTASSRSTPPARLSAARSSTRRSATPASTRCPTARR